MRAVEQGGRDWQATQSKLRLRRDAMRAHVERTNPRNLLSRARTDNVNVEIDHGFDREQTFFGTLIHYNIIKSIFINFNQFLTSQKNIKIINNQRKLLKKKNIHMYI